MKVLKKYVAGKVALFALLGLTMTLTGCGKGFQNSSTASGTDNTKAGDPGVAQPPTDPLAGIDYKGRPGSGGTAAGQGQLVLEIDRTNQALILVLPIPAEIMPFLGPIVVMEIPDLPGAKIMPRGTQLAVSIPLKYIVRGGKFKDPNFNNVLPNGDPLPAFPAGEGADFALTITRNYVLNVYIGAGAAAVFVETPDWDSFMTCQNLPICPSFGPYPVLNEAKTEVLGHVALIVAKQAFHSGVYVTSRLSDKLARFIDDHIKY